jgi:hypothetical protein
MKVVLKKGDACFGCFRRVDVCGNEKMGVLIFYNSVQTSAVLYHDAKQESPIMIP